MATIKSIAEQVGVSHSTVSRVLNGKARDARISDLRARTILRVARQMNYRPHAGARNMVTGQSYQVGVLLRNAPSHYRFFYPQTFEVIQGLNETLQAQNYMLTIVRYDDVQERTESLPRVFREKVLDGMVVLGLERDDWVWERVHTLMPQSIWVECSNWSEQRCIRRDERRVGLAVAQQVLAAGYREILWVGPRPTLNDDRHYSILERWEGARRELDRAGDVTLRQMDIDEQGVTPSELAMLEEALRPEVAVIAYSAIHAQRLVHTANDLGRTPPRDFGLVCCDEDAAICSNWPQLSRVTFDRFGLGVLAADQMLQLLQEPGGDCPSRLLKGHWKPGRTLGEAQNE